MDSFRDSIPVCKSGNYVVWECLHATGARKSWKKFLAKQMQSMCANEPNFEACCHPEDYWGSIGIMGKNMEATI